MLYGTNKQLTKFFIAEKTNGAAWGTPVVVAQSSNAIAIPAVSTDDYGTNAWVVYTETLADNMGNVTGSIYMVSRISRW